MYLLKRLKEVRRYKGYTLRELGSMSGVAYTTIFALENLRRKAQLKTVKKLADALEVETEELLGPETAEFSEIEPPAFAMKVLDYSDNVVTVRAYEMGEFVLLVRQQLGECAVKVDEEPEISGIGWRVTVFHPLCWASSLQLEAATQVVPRQDLLWFSGMPMGGYGEPYRTTMMSVQSADDS